MALQAITVMRTRGAGAGAAAAARGKWHVTKTQPYAEGADAAYRLALRGCDEPLDREFFDLAERVFRPLLTHIDDAL